MKIDFDLITNCVVKLLVASQDNLSGGMLMVLAMVLFMTFRKK
jgi:hypothetical protein